MDFNPACLINVLLALLALFFYIIGSYRFFRNRPYFLAFFALAICIDIATALLASFRITPTTEIPDVAAVPWYSLLFKVHVFLSTAGILGFVLLFVYLLVRNNKGYSERIRSWQFRILLPIWVIGEGIALSNALAKILFHVRLFEYL